MVPFKSTLFWKRWFSLLLVLSALLVSAGHLEALEGVGALADRLGGTQSFTLFGRTCPWAELVVVDPLDPTLTDRIWVLAELEPTGTFRFTFRVNPAIYPRLQLFAIDEFGSTNRIAVPDDTSEEQLLPPTIVNDVTDTSTNKAALTGCTFPESRVTLSVTNLDSGDEFEATLFALTNGYWTYLSDNLAPGRYKAVAVSRIASLESQSSQEIFFEIPSIALPPVVEEIIRRVTEILPAPVLEVVEAAPIITQLAVPVAVITTGLFVTDLIALLLKLLLALLHLLGFRKNRRSWGVVYNAVTKQPLERAIVRLYDDDTKRLVETDVTGSDGVFSFLPKAGHYTVKVNRQGFVFPSKLVRTSGNDGEYERIYHGEVLTLREDQVVAISIPMDPLKAKSDFRFRLQQVWRRISHQLNWGILTVGLLFSLFTFMRRINLLNTVVLAIYLGLFIWSLIVWRRRVTGYGRVLDKATNKPVAGVGVSLYDTEFNRLVQRRVSDENGRFQLLVPPGTYRLDVVSLDWVLDVSGPKGFRGELLTAKGKKTNVLTPTVYVTRRQK